MDLLLKYRDSAMYHLIQLGCTDLPVIGGRCGKKRSLI